jgi:hypothetical protein
VIRNFGNRGLDFLRSVPSTARCVIKAGTERPRVEKGSPDNVRVCDPVHQFKLANSAQSGDFSLDSLICCSIQPGNICKHLVVLGDVL